jgi:hypothetical protein
VDTSLRTDVAFITADEKREEVIRTVAGTTVFSTSSAERNLIWAKTDVPSSNPRKTTLNGEAAYCLRMWRVFLYIPKRISEWLVVILIDGISPTLGE